MIEIYGDYSILKNKPIIFIITIVILIIAIITFITNIVNNSQEDIQFESQKIENNVRIFENNIGIPYVIAENENDMIYGIGIVHAKNRLWQLELQRRISQGKLSEILGPEFLDADRFMRSFELERTYKKMFTLSF